MKVFMILITSFFLTASYGKTLIIGTKANNPPFSSLCGNAGNFFGFEIEIMLDICARLNAECQFRDTTVRDLLKLVRENDIDLAIAAVIAPMPNSPDAANYVFSTPYYISTAQFMVRKDSNIKVPQDLRNKTVGVHASSLYGGSLFKEYLISLYNGQLRVNVYPNMPDLLDSLQNKMVEAIFSDTEAIRHWSVNHLSQFQLIGDVFPVGNGYSIIGKKGDENLMASINRALFAMQQDGTYNKLVAGYFTLEGPKSINSSNALT